MGRCKDCSLYTPATVEYEASCASPKFIKGYGHGEAPPDSVAVENDEGWGFSPGPEFGCVHFHARH